MFEDAVAECVRQAYAPTRLASGLAVRDGGQTLGELDLYFESAKFAQPQHWELAFKLYLRVPGTSHYVGPSLRDRLSLKQAHLVNQQLTMRERLGLPGESRTFVKGWLFDPWSPSLGFVVPEKGHGFWVTESIWAEFCDAYAADSSAAWSLIFEPAQWLRKPPESVDGSEALLRDLTKNPRGLSAPQAYVQCVTAESTQPLYVFCVPNDWPERAGRYLLEVE